MRGFTFIEVLVAMLIFVLAVVAAVDLVRGAVRSTTQTRELSVATWLVQNTMTELETKLESLGIQKGCEDKAEAKFEAPYEDYRWITYCSEIDFKLSQTADQLAQVAGEELDEEEDPFKQEDQTLKLLLGLANDYMSQAARELHAEVLWGEGEATRSVSLTTHFVRLDLPFNVPDFTGGGGGGSGSGGTSTGTGTSTGGGAGTGGSTGSGNPPSGGGTSQ